MTANSLRELALKVLKKRDSTWDSCGTAAEKPCHGQNHAGTANIESQRRFNPTVPVSQTVGRGTVGHLENYGTVPGTVVRQSPYSAVLAALKSRCPELVEPARWQQAIQDAESFLAEWGGQAESLGWTSRDLFGLAPVPDKPGANFQRLSRYDLTGLIWLLRGDQVVALTETIAAIRHATGHITTYRRFHKPALGPLGDSLEDIAASISEGQR